MYGRLVRWARDLHLCPNDPWVNEDYDGSLRNLTVHDGIDSVFSPHIAASKVTPQQLFRTGYGVRLTWDIAIEVATSRIGFLAPDAFPKPEVNDGSLWHNSLTP